MKVAFGISLGSSVGLLGGSDTQKFMELVRMADGYGAAAIGTYDSAFLGGDAYVRATMMALAAPRAAIGLRPSNPLTREPQVMASFLASIDALTGGRAFLDIASGDSAVFNIGYPAASRARIEDYVTCIRGLLAGGEATYQGRPQRVRWAPWPRDRGCRSRSAPRDRRCSTWAAASATASSPARDSCPR